MSSYFTWQFGFLGERPIPIPVAGASAAVTALVKAFPVACTITSTCAADPKLFQGRIQGLGCRITAKSPELKRMWLNYVKHVPWNTTYTYYTWQVKFWQGWNSIPVSSVCVKIGAPSFITSFHIQSYSKSHFSWVLGGSSHFVSGL